MCPRGRGPWGLRPLMDYQVVLGLPEGPGGQRQSEGARALKSPRAGGPGWGR
jgi:hypothetical protein